MNTTHLGDLADLRAGFGFPKLYQGRSTGDLPFAKVGDISRVGRSDSNFLTSAGHFIDEADLTVLKARTVPAGSTLFAKIGEAIRQEHRVMAGCPVVIDNNAMAAVPKFGVDPQFLFRFLQTVKMYSMTSSTTVPALRKSDLELIPAPRMDMAEQRRVVAILDKADDLRTKRRQALAHLDALTQSIFDASAQKLSAKDAVPLAELCGSIQTGPFGSLLHREDYVQNGVPLINPMHVISGKIQGSPDFSVAPKKFDELRSYHLQADDIVIARRGEMGRCALVAEDQLPLLCGTGSMIVRPDSQVVSPRYLQQVLSSPSVRRQLEDASQGVTMSNLNGKILSSLRVRMPKLARQREFAIEYEAIERLRTSHANQLDELDVLFACLQHRAFSGQL